MPNSNATFQNDDEFEDFECPQCGKVSHIRSSGWLQRVKCGHCGYLDGYDDYECSNCQNFFQIYLAKSQRMMCPYCGNKGTIWDFLTQYDKDSSATLSFNATTYRLNDLDPRDRPYSSSEQYKEAWKQYLQAVEKTMKLVDMGINPDEITWPELPEWILEELVDWYEVHIWASSIRFGTSSKLPIDSLKTIPDGLGISISVPGEEESRHYKYTGKHMPYPEPPNLELQTYISCANCELNYGIYGVYAYCPNCGEHNSLQILHNNLDIAQKKLALAQEDKELVESLIHSALMDIVSSFDGFGRYFCDANAAHASDPKSATKISFQDLNRSLKSMRKYFGIDLKNGINVLDWEFANKLFQKRHLIAHTNGVINDQYIKKSGDSSVVIGHKIQVTADEVTRLIVIIRNLSSHIAASI